MAKNSNSPRAALIAAGLCGAALVALPAVASAATADVQVGDFNPANAAVATTYYPSRIVVHQGDSVKFNFRGFHTATFLKRGQKMPSLIVPTGQMNPVTNDAAGNPFWWSGVTPALGINPLVAAPTANTAVTGKAFVNSGLPENGPNPSFTVSFPRVGTFVVRCAPHPKMRATVKVLPKKAKTPQASRTAARVAKEKAADARTATMLLKKKAPKDTVLIAPGTQHVAIFAFRPAATTINAGDTLTFRMAGRNENHTVSFGPANVLAGLSQSFAGPAPSPQALYPSDPPPAGVPSLTATSHGDGFLNSGILADPGTGAPLPTRFQVRFPEAGTYNYICIIHPEMKGTVTVK